jgi:hypothetical protein
MRSKFHLLFVLEHSDHAVVLRIASKHLAWLGEPILIVKSDIRNSPLILNYQQVFGNEL